MIYVLVSPAHAEQLSRSLMRLLRPSHLRDETWTDLYCTVVSHPSNGQSALALPETEQVPIHVEASGDELAAICTTFVENEALTAQEADGIVAAVRANAGKRVSVADFIPPSWSPWVLTQGQADAAGWFPDPPESHSPVT